MTSSLHSEDRISLNRKRYVAFISVMFWFITKMQFLYKNTMVYFYNFVIFLKLGWIETQRLLGISCSSKVLSRYHANIGKERITLVNK